MPRATAYSSSTIRIDAALPANGSPGRGALRAAGFRPAVVHGQGVPSESVQIETRAFDDLARQTSRNTLVDLAVDGAKPRRVLIYALQRHPAPRRPVHLDLFV